MGGKVIQSHQGIPFTVDEEDFEWAIQWNWHSGGYGYIARPQRDLKGKQSTVFLHIEICKRSKLFVSGLLIDHKDQNKFNNVRSNLRLATKSQNGYNSKLKSNNTTGYRGVSFDKTRMKYVSQLSYQGKHIFLGYFNSAKEAAYEYNRQVSKFYGEFAVLNEDV